MKRLLSLLLAASMVLPLGVNTFAETGETHTHEEIVKADEIIEVASGYCGQSVTWKVTSDGVLTIGGEGGMYDNWGGPWYQYNDVITDVVIGKDVSYVSCSSFSDNYLLERITVEAGNPYFAAENGVLYNSDMTRLMFYPNGKRDKAYVISDSVTEIHENAVFENEYLEELTLGGGISYAPTYLFSGFINLKAYKTAEGSFRYSVIDGVLFENGGRILAAYPAGKPDESYSIPEGVEYIDTDFWNSHLKSVHIPATVVEIQPYMFANLWALETITVSEANRNYSAADGVIFNKNKTELILYPSGKSGESYTIPDTVAVIGESSFQFANVLKTLNIPASVQLIGDRAFLECVSLEKFVLDEASEHLYVDDKGILYDAAKTILYKCPPSASSVGVYKIPGTVKTIPERAFGYNASVTEVTIPESVTFIDFYAFVRNDNLTKITIEGNPQLDNSFIHSSVYRENFTLCGLTGSGVEKFAEKNEIPFVSVGTYEPQVTATGTYGEGITWSYRDDGVITFSGTGSLGFAYDEDVDEIIPAAPEATWCDLENGISEIVINEGITEIGNGMFFNCRNAKTVTVAKSVKKIGEKAFCYNVSTIKGYNATAAEIYALGERLVFVCLDTPKEDVALSGSYKNSFTWELTNRGQLTVKGTGELGVRNEYDDDSKPWNPYTQMITSIVIDDGITFVGNGIFGSCHMASCISVASTVTEIEEYAFNDYNLEKICGYNASAAELYAIINNIPFEYLDEAKEVAIYKGTFDEIDWSLTNRGTLTLSGTGEVLHSSETERAEFDKIRNFVKTIEVSEGITAVREGLFYDCENLKKIILPESLVELEDNAFGRSVKEVAAYDGSIGELYAKGKGLVFICLDENDTDVVKFKGDYSETVQWSLYDTGKLLISGTGALGSVEEWNYESHPWDGYNRWIRTIEIGEGITLIGNEFFDYNYYVTEIKVAASVKTFGGSPFSTSNLNKVYGYNGSYAEIYAKGKGLEFICLDGEDTEVIFDSGTYGTLTWTLSDAGVLTIGGTGAIAAPGGNADEENYPWEKYAEMVGSIVIEEGITELGDYCFGYNYAATSITLPESLTTIGNYGVYLYNIKTVTIPAGVTAIAEYAFDACGYLEEIKVDEANRNYASLNGVLFTKDMKNLLAYPERKPDVSYAIPEGIEKLNNNIINSNHLYLENLTIPASLTEIVNVCNYSQIRSFYVMEGNTAYSSDTNGVLFNADKTVLIRFPQASTLRFYEIPGTVTEIGREAFRSIYQYNGEPLTLTVPATVAAIDYNAFIYSGENVFIKCYNNSAMEEYARDNGLTYELLDEDTVEVVAEGLGGRDITWTLYDDGSMYFEGTGDMTDEMDYGYTSQWYDYRSQIKTVVIGEGITSVGDYSFYSCCNLSSVTLPSTLLDIGWYAFSYCTQLREMNLPSALTLIDEYAFAYTNLKSINIPASVTEIGSYAFAECDLAVVDIPASVETIEENAFYSCASLEAINVAEDNTNYSSDNGVFFDKNKTNLILYPGAKADESYTVPSTVTHILEDAFNNAQKLVSVVVPESVVFIGENAFVGTNLKSITVYGRETEFGRYVFGSRGMAGCVMTAYNASSAEYYAKDNGLGFEAIGGVDTRDVRASGTDCGEGLTWMLYDDGVLEITGEGEIKDFDSWYGQPWYDYNEAGDSVYSAIRTVSVGEGITRIGDYTFYYIEDLVKVILPDTLVSIGRSAFQANYSLTEIELPENLTEIEDYAFASCWKLTGINIPAAVTSIGKGVFSYDEKIASITVDEANTAFSAEDNILFDKNKTKLIIYAPKKEDTEYVIPDGVLEIAPYAFCESEKLKTLTIPESVTKIGAYSLDVFDKITIYSKTAEFADDALINTYNLTVYGYDGSTAEIYCQKNDISFVTLDEDKVNIRAEGSCGENVTYTLDEKGVLTIKGTGAMTDFNYYEKQPWKDYMDEILTVVVESGVTHIGTEAFYYANNLSSLTLSEGLLSIGSSAFASCDDLTAITLPDSLTEIGRGAFSYVNISEVHISAGVVSIGNGAFTKNNSYTVDEANTAYTAVDGVLMSKDKTVLVSYPAYKKGKTYIVPETVTKIAEYAFSSSEYITSLDIHENVTEIGTHAFSDCWDLVTLTIRGMNTVMSEDMIFNKDSALEIHAHDKSTAETYAKENDIIFVSLDGTDDVEIIDSGSCGENAAFTLDENGLLTISGTGAMEDYSDHYFTPWYDHFTKIKKVVIEDGVTHIGNYAFDCLYNLTEAVIAESVVTIGNHAFESCNELGNVNIPKNLVSIGDNAFEYCHEITAIHIPASLTSIGYRAFNFMSKLAEITVAEGNTAYAVADGVLFTKDMKTLIRYPEPKKDTEYSVPDTVEVIEGYAFSSVDSLVKVTVPSSVKSIGEDAFESCYQLEEVRIESKDAVFGRNVVSEYYAPVIKGYDNSTAEFYAQLNELPFEFIEGEDTIGVMLSGSCGDTLTFELTEDGVLTVGGTGEMNDDVPWYDYKNMISSVIIESGVTSIGDSAFENCKALDSVELPEGLDRIGDRAFKACSALEGIMIPKTVSYIGTSVFADCSAMREFEVDEGNAYYSSEDGVLFNEEKNILLVYPKSKPDTSYELPDSVTYIDNQAFYEVGILEELTVGENVTYVGYNNFYSCPELEKLTILANTISFGGYGVINNHENFKVYCYEGSDAYVYVVKNNIPYEILIPESGCKVAVTIADSSFKEITPIDDASIFVYSDPEKTADRIYITGADGKANMTLEEGRYTFQVVADGYIIRNANVVITENTKELTIFVNSDPIMKIETNVKPITKDEAVAAGIDPNDYGNKQIYECTAVLEFVPEIKYHCVDGKVIDPKPVPVDNHRVLHIVAEGVYLIVPSQVSWLKEMFEVQLLVTNTSAHETLEDVVADIDIPAGLSLAVMSEEAGQQSEVAELGDIEAGKTADHKWYIAGDKEGTYKLNGVVDSVRVGGGVSEEVHQTFSTQEPISVLAGSSMELVITAEMKATAGKTYRMKYELINKSDKTLYDVSLNVFGGKFYQDYTVEEITHVAETQNFTAEELSGGFLLTDDQFLPTEKLAGLFRIEFGEGIDLEFTDYILANIFTVTGSESTTEIPTRIVIVDSLEEHQWGSRQITEQPTCTKFGIAVYYCLDEGCDDVILEPIDALGHLWGSREYDPTPTCTEGGQSYIECLRCGEKTDIAEYQPLGHDFSEPVVTKEPTCTETGMEKGTCTRCGVTTEQKLPALGHLWSSWTVITPSGCETQGEMRRECQRDNCTAHEIEVTSKTGHNMTEWVIDPAPTCTSGGSKTRSCTKCSYTEIETLAKLSHAFGDAELVTEGSCVTDAEWQQVCKNCGYTDVIVVPAPGHTWGDWNTDKEPSCEEEGLRSRICAVCSETETEPIDMIGHDWSDWERVREPGCTESGMDRRICLNCKKTEEQNVPAAGHKYPGAWTERTAPTCTAEGEEYRNCSVCGNEETRSVPRGDHTYSEEWTVDVEAACTRDGSESRHCLYCEATTDELVIKAPGHNWGEWYTYREADCRTPGISRRECSRCGEYMDESIPVGAHRWDKGVVTKKPTLEEFGIRTYTCLVCGETRTEQIPKLILQDMGFAVIGSYTTTYGKYTSVNMTAFNDSEDGGEITYSSSNEEVATVNKYGRITIHNAGTTVIKATAAETEIYAETTDELNFIVKKAPLTVTPAEAEIYYGDVWTGENPQYTAEGFVYDEDVSVIEGEAVIASDYEKLGHVGEYTLSISGLTARNYDITFKTGVLRVLKAKEYTIEFSNLTHRKGHVTPVEAATVPHDPSAVIAIEYKNPDGTWSETIPEVVGEIEVRGVLTSAENIEVSETPVYFYCIMTVKGGATIGNESGEIVENGDNLEIKLDGEDAIENIINNVPEDSKEVVIDVTNYEEAAEAKNLTIPGDLVEALAESDKVDSMTVIADKTEVTMDSDVLNTVSEALKDKEEAKMNFRVDAVDVEDMTEEQQEAIEAIGGDAAVLELTMTVTHKDENGEIVETDLHELNGNVMVRAEYQLPEDMQNKRVIVCYVSDDGTVTYLRAKYVDGYVEFSTFHFSYYAISTAPKCVGDIDGNGKPDENDVRILEKYFAGWPEYHLNTADASDYFSQAEMIDKQPGLTRKDLMILSRYVAGWGGIYEGYFAVNNIVDLNE